MPIASNADFIPVIDQMIGHWTLVNETQVIIIPDGELAVTVADLQDVRDNLDETKTLLQTHLNDLEVARITLNQARETAADRLAEFNRRIRAQFPTDPRVNKLPLVPTRTAGRDPFVTAMDDAINVWTRVDAFPTTATFTAPLVLQEGFNLALLTLRRTELDTAFTVRRNADTQTALTRSERDGQQARALLFMTGYRAMIEAVFPADSPFVLTLPALRAPEGHTPAPVTIAATWVPAETKAQITWEPSEEPTFQDYQLRATIGPDYNADDATTLHTFLPGDPREFLTGANFAIPGQSVTYKVYVRLTTGNEAGSDAATVTRPL